MLLGSTVASRYTSRGKETGDGGADRVGVRLGVHERPGGAELTQSVDVAVAHERLAVRPGPGARAPVEVDTTGIQGV